MTDNELKRHVENALAFEPSIDAANVGVSVANGVVTLRGDVASFTAQFTAERVAQHVYGVRAVANDLKVRLPGEFQRSDTDIALAAANALQWSTVVPAKAVSIAVTNGWITLKGAVDWQYQKDAAARAVRDLVGVRGVENLISLEPKARSEAVQDRIEAAFRRSAQLDARRIAVVAEDGKIILNGHVRSWVERQEAERAAWAAPGVTQVDDRLTVVP